MVMQKRTVRELAKGEFFRLTESDTAPVRVRVVRATVWGKQAPVRVRGEYSRHAKKYSTHRFDDVNHKRLLRGEQLVWVGFTF